MWEIKQVCHDFLKEKRRGNYILHLFQMTIQQILSDGYGLLVCAAASRITHICVLVVTVGNKEHFGNFVHSA